LKNQANFIIITFVIIKYLYKSFKYNYNFCLFLSIL